MTGDGPHSRMTNDGPHTRAFVVQFHVTTNPEAGRFEGHAEHVASGRAARFHTLPELLEFFRRTLATAGAPAVEE